LVYLAVVETWKAIKRRMGWGSGKSWALVDGEDVESRIWESFMADSTREGTLNEMSAVTTRTNTLVEEEGGILEKK